MTKKIAVSLPDDTFARAKAVVRTKGAESVSGYIASLIDRDAAEESFREMLERWGREDGREAEELEQDRRAVRAAFTEAGLVPPGGSARAKRGRRRA